MPVVDRWRRLSLKGRVMDLVESMFYFIAVELIIEADKLYSEANRVESWNPPWARNRRRKANKLMDKAVVWCGKRGLPWGVPWPPKNAEICEASNE